MKNEIERTQQRRPHSTASVKTFTCIITLLESLYPFLDHLYLFLDIVAEEMNNMILLLRQ